jgi:hypothetical protein
MKNEDSPTLPSPSLFTSVKKLRVQFIDGQRLSLTNCEVRTHMKRSLEPGEDLLIVRKRTKPEDDWRTWTIRMVNVLYLVHS